MSFILQGTIEAQIDSQLSELSVVMRNWELKMAKLITSGNSFKRAAYIVDGSPLGKVSNKRVKLWFIRRRNSDRALTRRLKELKCQS